MMRDKVYKQRHTAPQFTAFWMRKPHPDALPSVPTTPHPALKQLQLATGRRENRVPLNRRERYVYDMFKRLGWTILRNGAPDFIMVRGTDIQAVEVKSPQGTSSELSTEQQAYRDLLKRLGVKYRIIHVR